jgi:diaminopimelate epimerase
VTSVLHWTKGHGTENDFLLLSDLLSDPQAGPRLTPALVRALCDRRAGVGADGVLRVVPATGDPDAPAGAGQAQWFMDYRNADGSLAEMCGNGLRVFARYLVDAGLAEPGELAVGTRGGVRTVWVDRTGDVTVDMGAPALLDARSVGWPATAGRAAGEAADVGEPAAGEPAAGEAAGGPAAGELAGVTVLMPNPHVVVLLPGGEPGLAALGRLDLSQPPAVTPPLPGGQNVEFVVRTGPRALALRVHERGSGETRSCGTGVCAAVVAAVHAGGAGRAEPWTVDVPGGRLTVCWTEPGPVLLTGPAVLVASGQMTADWLSAVPR